MKNYVIVVLSFACLWLWITRTTYNTMYFNADAVWLLHKPFRMPWLELPDDDIHIYTHTAGGWHISCMAVDEDAGTVQPNYSSDKCREDMAKWAEAHCYYLVSGGTNGAIFRSELKCKP